MSDNPKPDEFGRYRVTDQDTKVKRSIHAAELAHGNYTVLKQDASDVSGDALPPEFPEADSGTNSGQSAGKKE